MLLRISDKTKENKMTRLNKYIANSGLCSRRKADELIFNGNVRINGVTVKEPGYQVTEDDKVAVNGKPIIPVKEKVYVVINKPLGYVTTMDDQFGRYTVADLVSDFEERLFPVGRLDYNTTGLLIMTNDGDMAYRLTHPKHEVTKTYRARISGYISDTKLNMLRRGVDIGGFITSKARVDVVKQLKRSTIVEIEIHEGKNRQVRKMFSKVGHPVQELERVAIGDIKLGRLATGHYRKLTEAEIKYLKGEN